MKTSPSACGTMRLAIPIFFFLLFATSLEMLLSIAAVLFDVGADSFLVYVIYFSRETLILGIPAVMLSFLLASMRRLSASLLLCFVPLAYACFSLLLNVIKTMFFCHFMNDVIWDSDVCFPYLWKECKAPLNSLALTMLGAVILFYVMSKKMQGKRPLSLSPLSSRPSLAYALAALIFFLRAALTELTGSLIPFIERINLGYVTASIGDLIYIVFKFLFYFICAAAVYLLAHKFDRYIETKTKTTL